MSGPSQRLRNAFIYIASSFVILASAVFIVITLYPFTILDNWKLSADRTEYNEGDVVRVRSEFTKTMDAQPTVNRGLECKSKNGSLQYYPIVSVNSGGKTGKRDSTYDLTIPLKTVNGLPTQCRVHVNATYRVFIIRDVPENAETDFFTVNPKVLQ